MASPVPATPAPQQADSQSAPAQETPAPQAPPVRRPRPNPPQPAAQPPQSPAPAAPQPEFRLGQPLTPEEQRAHSASIDQHLAHANAALATIGSRRLTDQQKSIVAQIRGFIAQVQQLRSTDLVGARTLAEKADVLASDLLASLK